MSAPERSTAANDSLKSNRFSIEIRDLLQSYVGRVYIFLLALWWKSQREHPQKVNIRTVKLIQIRDCSSSEIDNVAIQRVIHQSQQITENNSGARSRTKRSEIPVSIIPLLKFFCSSSVVNQSIFVLWQNITIIRRVLLKYFT